MLNPIVYVVNAFRYGVLGHSDVPIFSSLLLITLITAAMFAFALHLLNRGTGMRD